MSKVPTSLGTEAMIGMRLCIKRLCPWGDLLSAPSWAPYMVPTGAPSLGGNQEVLLARGTEGLLPPDLGCTPPSQHALAGTLPGPCRTHSN